MITYFFKNFISKILKFTPQHKKSMVQYHLLQGIDYAIEHGSSLQGCQNSACKSFPEMQAEMDEARLWHI